MHRHGCRVGGRRHPARLRACHAYPSCVGIWRRPRSSAATRRNAARTRARCAHRMPLPPTARGASGAPRTRQPARRARARAARAAAPARARARARACAPARAPRPPLREPGPAHCRSAAHCSSAGAVHAESCATAEVRGAAQRARRRPHWPRWGARAAPVALAAALAVARASVPAVRVAAIPVPAAPPLLLLRGQQRCARAPLQPRRCQRLRHAVTDRAHALRTAAGRADLGLRARRLFARRLFCRLGCSSHRHRSPVLWRGGAPAGRARAPRAVPRAGACPCCAAPPRARPGARPATRCARAGARACGCARAPRGRAPRARRHAAAARAAAPAPACTRAARRARCCTGGERVTPAAHAPGARGERGR